MKNVIHILFAALLVFFSVGTKANITNYAYNSTLVLYPNPAINTAHIVLPDIAMHKVSVYIIDLRGQVMAAWVFAPGGDQLDLDITSLPAGDYSIRIQEQDHTPGNIRLIKQ